jgi:glycosyltransferase involved in cell wall biosynthesis
MRRIPFVFDIRDLWPEVAVEAGEFTPDGRVTKWMERLANFLYRRADFITPVTENKRKKLLAAGVPAAKTAVVTNGVDLDYVTMSNTGDKRSELSLENKFIVLYAGLIGIAQGVEIAIHAANNLRHHSDIHFVIVGDGPRRDQLRQQVSDLALRNVTMIPRQPREMIPAFLRTADVALVPLVSSNLDDAVPSKLLEAWAYGRPAILAAGGEAADIVRRSAGGVVVSPEEPDCLAESILTLKNDPDRLDRYARNGFEYVQQNFDRRLLARQMAQVLEKTVDHR